MIIKKWCYKTVVRFIKAEKALEASITRTSKAFFFFTVDPVPSQA